MNITLLISYLIAIAVPIFSIYMIFALDLYGTGKRNTVLICLTWGAVGAFSFAYYINTAIYNFFLNSGNSNAYTTVVTLTAPIVEEILKSLILVYFIQRPRFRYVVDGAVYGFASGIGFSVAENFLYISNNPSSGLVLAISRVLSTSLMHATASATVGIALGHLRRSRSSQKFVWSIAGILSAITIHIIFNNLLDKLGKTALGGTVLLLIGIAIGFGGSAMIGFFINKGLADEKKRFEETLGLNVGVSSRERKAVQQFGGSASEAVLHELAGIFGEDKAVKIRRLLAIQANMGILQNNLNSPVSPRLRKAWEEELAKLRIEADGIRNDLGVYVMSFLRGVFPPDDNITNVFNREFGKSDPTVIHTFDVFMTASKLAGTVAPEQLEATADLLSKVEFFKNVAMADLENLSRAITPRTFPDGEIVFNEGDQGDAMYLIQSGAINLYTKGSGEPRLLRTCRAGEVVGELALLDGQPRSAQARAGGSLTVLMLRRDQFIMFLQSRPQVILAILKFLVNRVRQVTTLVETGITWAGHIAQGNYEQARAIGELAPAVEMPSPESVAPNARTENPAFKTGTFAAVAPVRVGGAFASLASAIQEREQAVQKKAGGEGLSGEDIAELPVEQKQVMEFLMKDPLTSMQGITIDLLQAKLSQVQGISDIISGLVKDNWLLMLGTAPNVRYKVNYKRKRTRLSVKI